MKSFKQYSEELKIIDEHCKVGELYAPFNVLQIEVFLKLHELLYGNANKNNNEKLMDIITQTKAAKVFGDELCKQIDNHKVKNHTMDDIKHWATELYKRITS